VLGKILSRKGLLSEEQLTEALGVQWNMLVVSIDERSIGPAIDVLPLGLITRLNVLPLEIRRGNTLLVALILYPYSFQGPEFLTLTLVLALI